MSNKAMGIDCCGDRYPCNTTIRCDCGCGLFYCSSCYDEHLPNVVAALRAELKQVRKLRESDALQAKIDWGNAIGRAEAAESELEQVKQERDADIRVLKELVMDFQKAVKPHDYALVSPEMVKSRIDDLLELISGLNKRAEALESENKRLREALEKIAKFNTTNFSGFPFKIINTLQSVARAALRGE